MSASLKAEIQKRQTIDENDIGASDGHYDHCCAVYDAVADTWSKCQLEAEDAELQLCCGCPRTFHTSCIPPGSRVKPSFDGSGTVFLCDFCAPVGWQLLKKDMEDPIDRCYYDYVSDE